MAGEEILEYFKDINFAYNDCTRFDTLKRMLGELSRSENPNKWVSADVLNHWIGAEVLDRIKADMHETSEKHEDGDWYLREEWVDEIIDKYKTENRIKR